MSGRREPQVHEAARLMGQTSYIYEAGCAFAIDGETTLLTGDMVPDEDGTVYEQIEQRGIPKLLFEHFDGRLEYHAPWHHGRVLSHLFRGKVDVAEANALLGRAGHDDLRLLDNGAIGREMPADRGPHPRLPPGPASMVSKAGAVAAHARARGYDPADCIAVGDSVEDLEVAAAVGRFFVVANGPERDPGLRAALAAWDNATVTEGSDGRRLLRGGRLDAGGASLAASIGDPHRPEGARCRGDRDRRRAGVPGDHVLARGGRAADDRRQHRPRDAALAADRARDDRPPHRRRLRRAQPRQIARLHRLRPRARQPHRPPPPDDRALPHRRARHPLGRGPRGGRADRARDVAGAGGADARRDRRRHHLPPRPPDRRGRPRAGLAARRRRARRRGPRAALRERGRGAAPLPQGGRPRARASRARSRAPTRTASRSPPPTATTRSRRSVAETVSVRADPAPPPRATIPEQLVLSSDRYGR